MPLTIPRLGVLAHAPRPPSRIPAASALLALATIPDMPWVMDGAVTPRKVCQLALSVDHRVVDGQQGSQFLAHIGALLSDPAQALTY